MDRGGIGHYTAMLANAVSKRVSVTIMGQKGIKFDYIDHNIKIINVLEYSIGFDIKNLLSYKNIFILNRIKPNLIHVTTPNPLINFIVRFFFAQRYPLVVTVHDPKPHSGEIKNNWRSIFFDFFHILLVKKALRIIVHSDKHKTELIKRKICFERIVVIPHGEYSFFTKYRKDILPEKNCVLFFGRIVEYKGLEYLIKAVPIILKELSSIKIIIAGEGKFRDYEKLINSISKRHFEVHNYFIPDVMVAELFERSSLLILPYIEATQSGPLHIAYAFKKPVICTNVGALPEVVVHEKTGFIVPPKDIESLAKAIIKLLKDDELRKEMGENAYKIMEERMSWDNIAEKTIEVYSEAINEHKNKEIGRFV